MEPRDGCFVAKQWMSFDDWGPKTKQNTPSLETSREPGNANKHVQTPSSVAFATDKWRIRLRNRVTLDRPEPGAKQMKDMKGSLWNPPRQGVLDRLCFQDFYFDGFSETSLMPCKCWRFKVPGCSQHHDCSTSPWFHQPVSHRKKAWLWVLLATSVKPGLVNQIQW